MALKENNGVLTTMNEDFPAISRIYFKWLSVPNCHEYSFKNVLSRFEIRFSVEHKDVYTYEPSFCIEVSISVNIQQPRTGIVTLKFNILLDDKYNVLGIDPCCIGNTIITKCILMFSVNVPQQPLFCNEV